VRLSGVYCILYGITAHTGARAEKSDVELGHFSKRPNPRATPLKEGVSPHNYPQVSPCPISPRPTQPFLLPTQPKELSWGELKLWTAHYNSGRLPTQVECQIGLNAVNSGLMTIQVRKVKSSESSTCQRIKSLRFVREVINLVRRH
jgi:hypothetical protein